ncbi:uncharacterized protein LOC143496701 [Brachyhypopomus gauderio]|uniref:uncharacterized protein LOC143496701 n=1 Tax=Brachyhypopomus gauderio TaxID=698409 RepID=UPI004042B8C3
MDLLQLCSLPGALRCYRSEDRVVLQACAEWVKPRDQAWSSNPRDQAWSSNPRDQAWSAVVFLSELESHYQEERDALTALLNRVDRAVLPEMYLSLCVALRRAERETYSYLALLASKQQWDKWPYTRGSVSEGLGKLWLQEKQDHSRSIGQGRRTAGSIQQAVLHCLVLCQEQERRSLLNILHTLSLDELQGTTHDYEVTEKNADALRQGCVSSLRQLKASLLGGPGPGPGPGHPSASVSWADCAVHLLTRLSMAHEDETWNLLHTFPSTDASGLMVLLQKYEDELRVPKLHSLHELLQSHVATHIPTHTSPGVSMVKTPTLMDEKKTEQDEGQDVSSLNEDQELCFGCGGVLVPEDAPYLEILGGRGHRDEEDLDNYGVEGEGRGGGKKGKRDVSHDKIKEAEGRRELAVEETMGGEEERREAERGERSVEDREEVVCVEKQDSLITLAWSKPADGEITTGLPEEETVEETPADLLTNTQQVHLNTAHNEVEDSSSPEHTRTTEKDAIMQCVQDHSTRTTAESAVNGNITDPANPEPGPKIPHGAGRIYQNKAKLVNAVCEEHKSKVVCGSQVFEDQKSELVCESEVCEEKSELVCGSEVCEKQKSELVIESKVCEQQKSELVCGSEVCEHQKSELLCGSEVCEQQKNELVCGTEVCDQQKSELVCGSEVGEEQKSELVCGSEVGEEQKSELVCGSEVGEGQKSELVCGSEVGEEQQLQREATMRSLVHIQRRAELRWQQDRDRQLYRVQQRLSIIQNKKSDEDLLGLTQEDTFKQLAGSLQQQDEQQQKTLVKEKLLQLRRERSYVLQSRRERNTAGFKELLAPTAQHMTDTEDGL